MDRSLPTAPACLGLASCLQKSLHQSPFQNRSIFLSLIQLAGHQPIEGGGPLFHLVFMFLLLVTPPADGQALRPVRGATPKARKTLNSKLTA